MISIKIFSRYKDIIFYDIETPSFDTTTEYYHVGCDMANGSANSTVIKYDSVNDTYTCV